MTQARPPLSLRARRDRCDTAFPSCGSNVRLSIAEGATTPVRHHGATHVTRHARRNGRRARIRSHAAAHRHHHERHQAQRGIRTRRPQQDRARGDARGRRPVRGRSDARGDAHHLRPLRRRDHARTRRAVDPHRRIAHRRRTRIRPPGRAPARRRDRQGSRGPGNPRVLAVDRARPRSGPDQRSPARLRAGQRAQAQRRDRPDARPGLRLLRPAHAVRPLPAAPSAHAQGDRDAAAVLPAHRLRARAKTCPTRWRCIGAMAHLDYLPSLADAVQRRHHPRAAVELLPARLAAGLAGIDLPALRRHRASCRSSAAASASASRACVRAVR